MSAGLTQVFPPLRAVHQTLHSALYLSYSTNNIAFLVFPRSFLDLFGFAPADGGPKICLKEESFVHVSWAVTLFSAPLRNSSGLHLSITYVVARKWTLLGSLQMHSYIPKTDRLPPPSSPCWRMGWFEHTISMKKRGSSIVRNVYLRIF